MQLNCGNLLASSQHGKAKCDWPEGLDKLINPLRGVKHLGEDCNYFKESRKCRLTCLRTVCSQVCLLKHTVFFGIAAGFLRLDASYLVKKLKILSEIIEN